MKQFFTLIACCLVSQMLLAQNEHYMVDVQSNFYSPKDLDIEQGDTVTWTNMGGTHNVNGSQDTYPENPVGFDNGPASSASWTFTHVFTVPGFYDYRCDPHVSLGMVGTVNVNANSGSGAIVITEIMYNNPGEDNLEFVELLNVSDATVDLSGWSFTAGIDHVFAAGTTLAPGAYLLLSIDPVAFQDAFFITALPFENGSALSNNGELIQLSDANGNVIDEVDYDDGGAWPAGTDGDGGSLVLCDPVSDNALPGSWQSATTPTGIFVEGAQIFANPGAASECPDGPIVGFVFEDIDVDEDAGTITVPVFVDELGDATTMVNVSVSAASTATEMIDFTISNTMLTFSGDDDTLLVTVNIIDDATVEGLETIVLTIIDTDGNSTVDPLRDTYIVTIEDNDAEIFSIVINEIMYNPPGSDDLYEYLELYNADDETVDVGGYYFSSGISDTLPAISLLPGDFLLLAKDSVTIETVFGVAALQWSNGSLVNSGELLELRDPLGNIVDQVEYDDGGDWPEMADGGGSSLILCNPATDNALASNWAASGETTGVFEGGLEFLGSPGAANDCSAMPIEPEYAVYPIGILTSENEDGVADSINVRVEVQGVVYGNNLRPGGLQFTIIDDSGDGIAVFSAGDDFGYSPMEGDLVLIQGIVGQFNGLTQINVDSISLISMDNPLFDPTDVTTLNEDTESQLVKLSGFVITSITQAGGGFNVEVTNSDTTLLMRIDNDTGITEADLMAFGDDALCITGIGGQFDNSSPFDDGYQIGPRYLADITDVVSTNEPAWAREVVLFPVPAHTQLQVRLPQMADQLQLIDTWGRIVQDLRPNALQQNLSLHGLANGWYALRIRIGEEVFVTRLMKM